MTRWFFSDIRVRLLAVVLLAVLPALVLIVYTGLEQRQREFARAEEETLRLAQLASLDQEDLIESARQLLTALSRMPEIRDPDPNDCSALLQDLLRQFKRYSNFAVASPSGEVLCSALSPSGPVTYATYPWFQRALAHEEFTLGQYGTSPISQRAILSLASPVLDDAQQVKAIVIAGIDLEWLHRLFAQIRLPAGAALTVLDRNGTVLVRYPSSGDGLVGSPIPIKAASNFLVHRAAGVIEIQGSGSEEHVLAFSPLGEADNTLFVTIEIPKRLLFAEANWILTRNLLTLAAVLIVIFALAWIGTGLFFHRRLKSLVEATSRLSAGDLRARTRLPYSTDELSHLARSFDEMAASLERAQKEKNDFTAMIVHDLRSPLTTIMSTASILEEGLAGKVSEDQKKWIIKIGANARKLLDLINDFLDLSKIEAGRIEIVREPVDLDQLVQNSIENYLVLAEDKKINLNCHLDLKLPRIEADPRRLDQVLSNLLSNAIKFTESGGKIEVGAGTENGRAIRIWVKDTGVGISPEEKNEIFQKYRQTKTGQQTSQKGTGLGLVICRMIVEAHGGKIWVESEKGKGSTFYLSLPMSS